jgi:peptidoglycan/LPS O-acetylase OafA/YrhL
MVLLFHVFAWTMESSRLSAPSWSGVAGWVLRVTKPGWLGVDLFFVLSGFLITGILLRTRERPHYFRNFYGRRVLRIMPLYFAMLAVIYLVYAGAGGYVLLSALFMANITPLFGVPVVYGPLWSLAVEEHFYLVWPWVVSRLGRNALLATSLSVCVAEPICRAVGYVLGAEVFSASWFRFDGLAWGASVTLLFDLLRPTRKRVWVAASCVAGIGLGLLVVCSPFGVMTRKTLCGAALQATLPAFAFAGLVAAAAVSSGTWLGRIMSLRVLSRCGKWSYCIYLVHWLIMTLFDRAAAVLGFPADSLKGSFNAIMLRAACVVVVSVLVAAVSYRYFEEPLLQLKKRFA